MSEELCDDVPDYMSDDFLAKCIPEDVRPGLKRVIIATSLLFSCNIIKLARKSESESCLHIFDFYSHTKANVNTMYKRKKTN